MDDVRIKLNELSEGNESSRRLSRLPQPADPRTAEGLGSGRRRRGDGHRPCPEPELRASWL